MALSGYEGMSVLLVDDEPMVREVVGSYLARDGFEVHEAADGPAAQAFLDERTPDLVVLDVMLPGIDGLTLLASMRGAVPVIMLTARGEEADRVLGLELGADDYVSKPFSPRELSARVRAVLKRAASNDSPAAGEQLKVGPIVLDPLTRDAWVRDERVELKPREFDLLQYLCRHPRQVFSRAQLLEQVWESHLAWQDPSTVTVHVRRLRQAIEEDAESPKLLTTVWGVGYRLEP